MEANSEAFTTSHHSLNLFSFRFFHFFSLFDISLSECLQPYLTHAERKTEKERQKIVDQAQPLNP
jgi:hypothetical protein